MLEVKDKIRVIPTDFDGEFWHINEKIERKGILALAYVYHDQTHFKGFDLLVECAKQMPNETFTFAGFSENMIEKHKNSLPKNVNLYSFQNKEETRRMFQIHKLFLMPSITESFGQTLCESMLCGCIPIVSNVGVLPTIVRDQGFVLLEKMLAN
ncbi:MAG: glycosyltransferase family 4 protein [Saprospiraceae bacterium]|nr:glycosyltransferase family 4 protein [Saprospiraceae bacterium]